VSQKAGNGLQRSVVVIDVFKAFATDEQPLAYLETAAYQLSRKSQEKAHWPKPVGVG